MPCVEMVVWWRGIDTHYNILQVVETGFPEFATFSVGEGFDRRTVVCFQQQIYDFTLGLNTFEQARDTEIFTSPGWCGGGLGFTMGEGVADANNSENSLESDFDHLNSE